MKQLAKKLINRLGYALVTKAHLDSLYYLKRLPSSNIDALQVALGLLLSVKKPQQLKILQVGANDGTTDDPLGGFLMAHDCLAWLLEPLPDICERLKKQHAGKSRIKIFCEALTDEQSGQAIMYLPDQGEGADKYASFTKGFHKRIHIQEIRNADAREVPVFTINIADFCRREGVENFDVIQIDAEGMDARLVRSVLTHNLRPAILNFESLHINKQEADALFPIIQNAGYKWIHDCMNTCCVQCHLLTR